MDGGTDGGSSVNAMSATKFFTICSWWSFLPRLVPTPHFYLTLQSKPQQVPQTCHVLLQLSVLLLGILPLSLSTGMLSPSYPLTLSLQILSSTKLLLSPDYTCHESDLSPATGPITHRLPCAKNYAESFIRMSSLNPSQQHCEMGTVTIPTLEKRKLRFGKVKVTQPGKSGSRLESTAA